MSNANELISSNLQALTNKLVKEKIGNYAFAAGYIESFAAELLTKYVPEKRKNEVIDEIIERIIARK
jgi:uncharacterized membrane-anchored protein YjiN (DUF445 family)